MIRALVLRAPGINCDRETAHACRLAGFATDLLHINQLIRQPERLLEYHFMVLPGGFSYGDDLGAGTLLAKNLMIHLGEPLQRFVEEGRPLLGICNGFQVLVRAGLLPALEMASTTQEASLTINASARFECRWVALTAEPGPCIFTQQLARPIELPVAHGEGQFVLAAEEQLARLRERGQIALVYQGSGYPANPNGSIGNIAAVCNARGNVMGLMPHPERYVRALQHPRRRGDSIGHGDGLRIFQNAYDYAARHAASWRSSSGAPLPGPESDGPASPSTTNIPAPARATVHIPTVSNPYGGDDSVSPATVNTPDASNSRRGDGSASPATVNTPDASNSRRGDGSASPATQHAQAAVLIETPPAQEVSAPSISAVAAYAQSGVDIDAGERAVELMRQAVRTTHGPEVLASVGAFAGAFDAAALKEMQQPALVASTDGVGTKTLLAAQAERFEGVGHDIVNHCVNDMLTQGARPLFFMDYLAMGRLNPQQAARIVAGVAQACREVGCALLGGETAEMPDVYQAGAFDLAGTIVGVVEAARRPDTGTIRAGDLLLGLPSSGLHTNGYSLARRVFAPHALDTLFPELGEPLADALLRPHRCYLSEIQALFEAGVRIKGMAHITGGGFAGNISRILPTGAQAVIEVGAWRVPPLFELIARLGKVEREEMYRTFNMGVGMVLVVAPEDAAEVRHLLPETLSVGHIREGDGVLLQSE